MSGFETVIARYEQPHERFEELVECAAAAGMTHVVVTEGTPLATWQNDTPERSRTDAGCPTKSDEDDATRSGADGSSADPFGYDPYPSWYNRKLGLLKVIPPAALQPHVSDGWAEWADEVVDVLDHRCRLLREHGLKAVYETNEPQVLPEEVFAVHPQWRGPRVDQPNRARKPHFAPCVDRPAVQALYREAVASLLDRYPEIELFQFVTTDAGSGFCWADSLYPGKNGNGFCKGRAMADRVADFFDALDAGTEAAGTSIEYDLSEIHPQEWMDRTFENPERMARELESGQAINNLEGPNATPFTVDGGLSQWEGSILYPVRGIPQPVECVRTLQSALADPLAGTGEDRSTEPTRLAFNCPPDTEDLHLDVYERAMDEQPRDRVEAYRLLKSVATDRVGAEHADILLSLWFAIDDATMVSKTVPGHAPTMVGGVHQRWITRPFVPFPDELDPDRKRYYRDYLFQARDESHAEDLVDLQAMHLFEGWAARLLMTFVFDRLDPKIERAERLASRLADRLTGDEADRYRDLALRFRVLSRLHTNSRNAINYQAIRDHVREQDDDPADDPVLGTKSSWEREFMLETARNELDNTVELIELVKGSKGVVHCADAEEATDIRTLGPNLVEDLQRKVEIMSDHWTDYRRLFDLPNP